MVCQQVTPIPLLFECATGYALFLAKGITEVDLDKLESVEEYINRSPNPLSSKLTYPFHLITTLSFKWMLYPSVTIVTDKLIKFLLDNSPRPTYSYSIGITDPFMSHQIVSKTGLGCRCSILFNNVMRGSREKIDQFICLQPGELERAQITSNKYAY